jgi:hypothetical protein
MLADNWRCPGAIIYFFLIIVTRLMNSTPVSVESAAALPFSDGKVEMFGGSYFGATQLLI